jgi:hypothetical protein
MTARPLPLNRPAFGAPAGSWRDGGACHPAGGMEVCGSLERQGKCGGEASARPRQKPAAEEVDSAGQVRADGDS